MNAFAQWLHEAGLERYAAVFAENDIDLGNARTLTEADLKELGLTLGHRKNFLAALATLDNSAQTPSAGQSPSGQLAATQSGERRQITVLFCDLMDSTALSERLDPEDLRALMQTYRECCVRAVERFEGQVAQFLGDGIMAYFGWPLAHEDDAERAVRCALEIASAVKQVHTAETLRVRLGIATGPVVVGQGDGENKLAVGETPNLAARLQGLADTDQIMIAPSTRRLIGNVFELADGGEHALKGILDPVRAWRVQGVRDTEGRFEATRGGGALTPLVGRDEEVGLLLARWRQAAEGEGQVALLCGEPGIGKSRLMRSLRDSLENQAHVTLRYQCSPHHVNSALYPVIDHIERAAGFGRADHAKDKQHKLQRLLSSVSGSSVQVTPLFESLLNLPVSNPIPSLSPQKQKELTFNALTEYVHRRAITQPALMLFEDAHWIDPTSQSGWT